MSHPAHVDKTLTLYWPAKARVSEAYLDGVANAAHAQYKLVKVGKEACVTIAGEFVCKQIKITGTSAGVNNVVDQIRTALMATSRWRLDPFALHTTLCYGGIAVPMHRYTISLILDHNNGGLSASASAGGIQDFMHRQISKKPGVRVRRETVSAPAGYHHFIISAEDQAEVQRFASRVNAFIETGEGSESITKPLFKVADANVKGTLTALGWVQQKSGPDSHHWTCSPFRKAFAKGPLKPLAKVHGSGTGAFVGPSDSRLNVPRKQSVLLTYWRH